MRICVYKRTDLCLFHAIQILSSAQSLCSVACLLTLVPQHVALPPTREDWEVKLLQHVKWLRHYNTCNSSGLATHCGHVRKGSWGRRREEIATEFKHRCRKLNTSRNSSAKNDNTVILYPLSYPFKPVWLSLFCGIRSLHRFNSHEWVTHESDISLFWTPWPWKG